MLLSSTDIRNMAYNLSTRWNLPKNLSDLNEKLNPDPFIETETSSFSYPEPVDPDNWQTVVPDKIFVYSAHLDSWNFVESIIHVLGTIHHTELTNPNRIRLFCKIWTFREDTRIPNVYISEITEVNDLLKAWADMYVSC